MTALSLLTLALVGIAIVAERQETPIQPPREEPPKVDAPNMPSPTPPPVRIRVYDTPVVKSPAVADIPAETATAAGQKLLRDGRVPSLVGRVALSFAVYQAKAEANGARLGILDRQSGGVVGVFANGTFQPGGNIDGLSSRARDVTEEVPPAMLQDYLTQVSRQRGPGAYRIVVLWPPVAEARFVGTIAELLRQKGIDFKSVDVVTFTYRAHGAGVAVTVDEVSRNGQRQPVGLTALLWP